MGYSVEYNHPYKGVELVRRYGDPARHRHSIQVEINRKLYMDEATLEPHEGFAPLERDLRSLVERLLATDPRTRPVMDRVDALVIGAGVVGLAVARALAQAAGRPSSPRRSLASARA